MRNYWSCGKFADWLRGTAKPVAETGSGWRAWRRAAKSAHPVRYWIAEEALDGIQGFIRWPVEKLYDVKYYINNRWVTRTHQLTASSLKRGDWHEFETRVIHCLFDELVNFVEVELAWNNVAWDKTARERYKPPFYAWGWWRWRTWRSAEAGLDHLRWASELTDVEWLDDDQKHLAQPTQQALAARETLALYDWWKAVRPNRPDPHDASGWTEYCAKRTRSGHDLLDWDDETETERADSRKILNRCNEIEAAYEAEDTEMLIRLIKLRRALWT